MGHRFNLDFEDSAVCLVKFSSGTFVTIAVGWFSQDYVVGVELFGTVKHCEVHNKHMNPILNAAQTLTTGTSRLYWSHRAELCHFINCLILDKEPFSTCQDGLKDLEAIETAYRNQLQIEGK